MTLETQITPHLFLKTTAPSTPEGRKCPSTIVFFVTGNPGLLSYYHSFLSLLSEGLSAASIQEDGGAAEGPYMICGTSLAGFGGEQAESKLSGKANSPKPRAYTLQEQIRFVERQLNSFIQLWRSSQGEQSGEKSAVKPNVIIIGHSVGAYIAMEILRRHREGERPDMNMNIVGEILLFPTLVDIAKSSSGVKLSALLYIPFLALWASLLSRLLTLALPLWMLKTLVRIVMGNPPANVVESTVDFLRSPMGVYEAIYMAGIEMREIKSDRWSDDIWAIRHGRSSTNAPGTSSGRPEASSNDLPDHSMVLYFGSDDHWVASSTRDAIIKSKEEKRSKLGDRSNGLRIVLCKDEVAHGFCINHSDIMARKVTGFVRDILHSRSSR